MDAVPHTEAERQLQKVGAGLEGNGGGEEERRLRRGIGDVQRGVERSERAERQQLHQLQCCSGDEAAAASDSDGAFEPGVGSIGGGGGGGGGFELQYLWRRE